MCCCPWQPPGTSRVSSRSPSPSQSEYTHWRSGSWTGNWGHTLFGDRLDWWFPGYHGHTCSPGTDSSDSGNVDPRFPSSQTRPRYHGNLCVKGKNIDGLFNMTHIIVYSWEYCLNCHNRCIFKCKRVHFRQRDSHRRELEICNGGRSLYTAEKNAWLYSKISKTSE